MKQLLVYSLCFSFCMPLGFSADAPPLRGYSSDSARTERDWETKFRAVPDPANLRAYMQRMSAHPHHVGSPYDKDNAEWLLARLQEFGLRDVRIDAVVVTAEGGRATAVQRLERRC